MVWHTIDITCVSNDDDYYYELFKVQNQGFLWKSILPHSEIVMTFMVTFSTKFSSTSWKLETPLECWLEPSQVWFYKYPADYHEAANMLNAECAQLGFNQTPPSITWCTHFVLVNRGATSYKKLP